MRAPGVVDLLDRDALDIDLVEGLESLDSPAVGYVVEGFSWVSGEVVLDGVPPVELSLLDVAATTG